MLLLLCIGVYAQLQQKIDRQAMEQLLQNVTHIKAQMLLLGVLLLMLLNWSIELYKWQYLIKDIQELTSLNALKGMLQALALSLFTPNRIGEYSIRIMVLQKENRLKGLISSWLCSVSQLWASVVFGSLSAIYLYIYQSSNQAYLMGYVLIGSLACFILWWLFIHIKYPLIWLNNRFLHNTGVLTKLQQQLPIVANYKRYKLNSLLLLSGFRYITYCFQFYLLLLVCANTFSLTAMLSMAIISTIFLVQTIVPSFALADIGIRANIAIYLFQYFGYNNGLAVLSATTLLWCINLMLPALAGGLIQFKQNQ